jgi:hypothetical protein
MTTKARTDLFTVMLLPELLTALAVRTRYIPPYITQLLRKAQSPDGREPAVLGRGKLSSRSHRRCRFFVTRGAQHRDELSSCLALHQFASQLVQAGVQRAFPDRRNASKLPVVEPSNSRTSRLPLKNASAPIAKKPPSPPSSTERTLGCAGRLPPAPRQRLRNLVNAMVCVESGEALYTWRSSLLENFKQR